MSSSIEERIVSIKFNNTQFEAGVKTTMGTLDGLKKSLNFSAGISALNDLDAAGRKIQGPKLDTTGFNASVKSTVDAANNLKTNLKFDGVTKGLNDLDAAGKKVNLKLDAASFQSGAKAVVDAANTIKQNLNFDSVQRGIGNLKSSVQNFSFQSVITGAQGAARGLGELDLAGRAVSFLPISEGAEKAKQSISVMSIAGIAALASLAVKAVSVGAEMARSLIVDPAKSGLEEYETNLNSIQTILANTSSKGTTLGEVNAALEELNTYSDQTIYSFSEMARSIGSFTAAGVDLKTSTSSIKGIANVAALSGSNSVQAATAMDQLGKALASGTVRLQDWMSVENAGMGGQVFQDALTQTAKSHGKNVDGMIAKNGSFRESLKEDWLTSDVMNETLSKFTGDLSDAQLLSMGYQEDQIAGIQAMAKQAKEAATVIKTFSALTGTLAENTGSGWAKTWQLILGDFEQAKAMWTSVYGVLGAMVNGSADARNKLLGDWNALGGRTVMIEAVSNAFKALMGVLNPVQEAFRSVFPPTTGQQLYDFTVIIRNITAALIPGEQATKLISNTFKLLFTILKIGVDIIKGALGVVFAFFKAFATGGDSIAGSFAPLNEALETIRFNIANSAFVQDFFIGLNKVATAMGAGLAKVVPIFIRLTTAIYNLAYNVIGTAMHYTTAFARVLSTEFFSVLSDGIDVFWDVIEVIVHFAESLADAAAAFTKGGMQAAIDAFKNSMSGLGSLSDLVFLRITERVESIKRLADRIATAWDQVMVSLTRVWDKMLPLREAVSELFRDLGEQLKNVFGDVNYDDTLDMVNTGLLAGIVFLFRGMFKKLLGMGDGMKEGLMQHLDTTVESINGVLEGLTGTLSAMQQNLQADTLMKIAIAIGILAISVVALSMIDSGKLTKALVSIGVMVVILTKAMEALDKITVGSGFLKIPFIAASMIMLAVALAILVIPVMALSTLSWGELIKGLTGTIALMLGLAKAAEIMSKNPADLIATGIGLIAVAFAIKILASAVSDISELSFGGMIQGLIGVGVLLTALSIFNNMTKVNKGAMANAAGLILLGVALKIMASAMTDFAAMSVGNMIQGLIVMGVVLLMLSKFTSVARPEEVLKTAAAILILGFALKVIASAMQDFASLSWEDAAKGLLIMSIALHAMSTALARVPPNMLASAAGFIAIAVGLKILASALNDFAGMSWEEIAKGLTVLAASLVLISVAMIAMQGTLTGAAALLVVAVALGILAPVLERFGQMSWEEMLHGFAALAGIFVIFGLAGLVLAPIVPILFALGTSMAMLGLGLLGVGIGTVLFSVGLIAIATAVAVAGPILVAFIASILALIPLALMELGKGIVAFADVIGGAMPTFLKAFVALLETLLTAIQMVFPQLMETLWMVIVGLVDLLVRGIPLFIDAGMKIINGILRGIGDNIGEMANAAAKIIVEFLNGISRNLPSIIESGVNLVITFVEGMATSVRNNSDRMATAGADLAGAIIDGMFNGITQGAGRVIGAVGRMAGDALNGALKLLGIHSPSREFFKIGKYVDMGFANGVDKYAGLAVGSTRAMGQTAMDVLKKTVSKIGDSVGTDMNMSPVIRPVLDLSAVRKDAGQIDGLLTPNNLTIDGTYSKATTLATAERTRRLAAESATSDVAVTTSPNEPASITFVQNNHSPKALSRVEIYRDTKNQLSNVKKGALV